MEEYYVGAAGIPYGYEDGPNDNYAQCDSKAFGGQRGAIITRLDIYRRSS